MTDFSKKMRVLKERGQYQIVKLSDSKNESIVKSPNRNPTSSESIEFIEKLSQQYQHPSIPFQTAPESTRSAGASTRNTITSQETSQTYTIMPTPQPSTSGSFKRQAIEYHEASKTSQIPAIMPTSTTTISEVSLVDVMNSIKQIELQTNNERVEKMLKQQSETIYRLENTVKLLQREIKHSRTEIQMLMSAMIPRAGIARTTDFTFKRITSEDELKELETRLADNDFRTKFVEWLQANINRVEPENRMHEAMDLIMCKQFVPKISWTGRSQNPGESKIKLRDFTQILNVFQEIGSNESIKVVISTVANFFIRKLKHAHERTHLSEFTKTSCHSYLKKIP